tara:strand:+ start:1053 stop:1283 length:231 start_codon:yes stop_codon:yes gene_type:complete
VYLNNQERTKNKEQNNRQTTTGHEHLHRLPSTPTHKKHKKTHRMDHLPKLEPVTIIVLLPVLGLILGLKPLTTGEA